MGVGGAGLNVNAFHFRNMILVLYGWNYALANPPDLDIRQGFPVVEREGSVGGAESGSGNGTSLPGKIPGGL